MERKKETDGYSIHITTKEIEKSKKYLRYVEIGIVAFSVIQLITGKR